MEPITSILYEASLFAVFVAPFPIAAVSAIAFGVGRFRHRRRR